MVNSKFNGRRLWIIGFGCERAAQKLEICFETLDIVRCVSDSDEIVCYCSLNSLSVHSSP